MKLVRSLGRSFLALVGLLGLTALGEVTGLLKTKAFETAAGLVQKVPGVPSVIEAAKADPFAAATTILIAMVLSLLYRERTSGMADVRYAGHGSKQFFDKGRPYYFLYQARFVNQSQQETANVSALTDFWSRRKEVRGMYCRWAIGYPESDSPNDSGSKSHESKTEIAPEDVPARLNLVFRIASGAAVLYAPISTAEMVFEDWPILVRVRLRGAHVRETYWMVISNVPEEQRHQAIRLLSWPAGWWTWMILRMARSRNAKHSALASAKPASPSPGQELPGAPSALPQTSGDEKKPA